MAALFRKSLPRVTCRRYTVFNSIVLLMICSCIVLYFATDRKLSEYGNREYRPDFRKNPIDNQPGTGIKKFIKFDNLKPMTSIWGKKNENDCEINYHRRHIAQAELLKRLPRDTFSEEDWPRQGPFRIQRIFHQTWKTTKIPVQFKDNILSLVTVNQGWSYMYWTDDLAKELITKKQPTLLPIYDAYTENIRRADALRYVILFEVGGVYADLDMKALRPLDPIVRKYSCFLGHEPHEHPIIYAGMHSLVSNAFMACRKGHPFMKILLNSLPSFIHLLTVLDSTGPYYVTLHYRNYIADCSNITSKDDEGVYIAPPEYFMPLVDPNLKNAFNEMCNKPGQLTALKEWMCSSFRKLGYKSKPLNFSFTAHTWYHTYFDGNTPTNIDIHEIVPSVQFYM